ncbi:hypothetical protein P7C73_g2664, partial [Tremellales sp. Uapishka_1]
MPTELRHLHPAVPRSVGSSESGGPAYGPTQSRPTPPVHHGTAEEPTCTLSAKRLASPKARRLRQSAPPGPTVFLAPRFVASPGRSLSRARDNMEDTKIDWPAYMQQVSAFLDGERDYSKIEGETGPLVYPALHLYLHTLFHRLLPADTVRPAQYIYLGIYLLTFALVATIYYRARHQQILLIPLTLSKRLHSLFILRLFNDPLAMVFLYASVVAMMANTSRGWRLGSVLFSMALGIKMNILLFVPGLLVLLFQYRGLYRTIESVLIILSIQILLPLPFFYAHPARYLSSAFNLSRQFLYVWSVNWSFVPEPIFLSREFASTILLAFAWTRWSPVPGGVLAVLIHGLRRENWSKPGVPSPSSLPPNHIPEILFASNLIGILCARSLHYQFHSWYFHMIPLLLASGGAWRSIPLGISLWGLIEYAWSKAPATRLSSGVLLFAHLVLLTGLWSRDRGSIQTEPRETRQSARSEKAE